MKIKIFLLLITLLLTTAGAQNFSGNYWFSNPSNGAEISLKLTQKKNLVTGELIINGNDKYSIEGQVTEYYGETDLTGSIKKGNEISYFEAWLEGEDLYFVWIPSDAQSQPDYNSSIEVVFSKTNSNNRNRTNQNYSERENNSMNNNQQLDPALIGFWRYTDSYTSGDFSMVTEKYMEVRADGTYSYGNGKVAGGGNSGTFDSGSPGNVITGRWKTQNGIIYIDEGGFGYWVPYSGYYVEGNTLMLKFENGSKEIWHRQ